MIKGDIFFQTKLSVALDRTSHRSIRTWEYLACTDEIKAPLEIRLRCKINSGHSCTKMLFDVLASKKGITVKDLIDALTKLRRKDVKEIITDVHPGMLKLQPYFSSTKHSRTCIKWLPLGIG